MILLSFLFFYSSLCTCSSPASHSPLRGSPGLSPRYADSSEREPTFLLQENEKLRHENPHSVQPYVDKLCLLLSNKKVLCLHTSLHMQCSESAMPGLRLMIYPLLAGCVVCVTTPAAAAAAADPADPPAGGWWRPPRPGL